MSIWTSPEREALRKTVRSFAEREVLPHAAEWERTGELPRELHRKAGEAGLLGANFPESAGGGGGDGADAVIICEEMHYAGAPGGVFASLFTCGIAVPHMIASGDERLIETYVKPTLRGEKIGSLAITEPGGGSDVAALRTTARLDGDHYVVDGEKVFITSGVRADWITVAVRTGEAGSKGAGGVSMLLIPGDAPGLSRSPLQKMGWHCSDTAHLRFDGVRVPASHLLGREGDGFKIIMSNFNAERFGLAAGALGFAQACYDEALAWARQRKTFGAALVERQVIRHKLVDMWMRIASTEAWLQAIAARADAGDTSPAWVAEVCLLKNHATQTMQFCADQAVQILGGMGFMRGTVSERIYREVKVMMIGGGAEEIMKDLAARQLGL